MASKNKQEGVRVKLAFEVPRRTMLFNRFAVVPEGKHSLLVFGLQLRGTIVDQFVCAISNSDLAQQRQVNFEYLGRLGTIEPFNHADWQPNFIQGEIPLVNLIGLGRVEEVAEILLSVFSLKGALEYGRENKAEPLKSNSVALLRSDISAHQHFIRSITDRP